MSFIAFYEDVIDAIVGACPGADKFAHTYAGMAIWVAAALVGRWRLGALPPLLVVFAAEGANEVVDRFAHGSWTWPDTIGDMAATWFWPVMLTLLLRLRPSLTSRPI